MEKAQDNYIHILSDQRSVQTIDKRTAPSRHTRNFHGMKGEYAEHSIDSAVASGAMTSEDAGLIREFIAEVKATKGIGQSRSNKLTYTLVRWRSFIGPYETNTLADLNQGIERLKAARLPDGMPFKQNTLRDFLAALNDSTSGCLRTITWTCPIITFF